MAQIRDALGTRMKDSYEVRTQSRLPRRTHTVIRLDGVSFHRYTKHLARPFDPDFHALMVDTAQDLCSFVQGTCLAYVQSDEISLVLTDFTSPTTEPWFGGKVQKMTSVSAARATWCFNSGPAPMGEGPGLFDSRVFTIPDPVEVVNYLIWRQQDATRNSILMTAQAYFSQNRLHRKSGDEMQEMLWSEHGVNWNDQPSSFKRGTLISRVPRTKEIRYRTSSGEEVSGGTVESLVFEPAPAPIFTSEPGREILHQAIPRLPSLDAHEDFVAGLASVLETHLGVTCPSGHHTRASDVVGDPWAPGWVCPHCYVRLQELLVQKKEDSS
jgi:tRNA(His) 5'-end guanylyltransferase